MKLLHMQNQAKIMRMHFSVFVRTHSFGCGSTQSFMHLAPGLFKSNISEEVSSTAGMLRLGVP